MNLSRLITSCDKRIIKQVDCLSTKSKQQEIFTAFNQSFDISTKLFTQLSQKKSFYTRADPLRHPLIFYYGHTATFYVNKMILGKQITERIDPIVESTCAVGVDEMSWDDLNDKHYNWPEVDYVSEYREKVRNMVNNYIQGQDWSEPVHFRHPLWTILMGIHHDYIHLETSSVLIRSLDLEYVQKSSFWPICNIDHTPPVNEMVKFRGRSIQLGRDIQKIQYYGWDNEFGNNTEKVKDFQASKYLVSNGEFNKFVNDGGYQKRELWSEEGWNWVQYQQATMPRFWRKEGDIYKLRLITEEVPMMWSWPAEVNNLEAQAFCSWMTEQTGLKTRLPSEHEYKLMKENYTNNEYTEQSDNFANINLAKYNSPMPVDMHPQGEIYDIIGNVWQHTGSFIDGYNGFKVHPLYDDFSTPTFDGKHNILKGGSFISCGNEALSYSRYAFRRHFYQHAGFRYIQSDHEIKQELVQYEKDITLTKYIEYMFGHNNYMENNFQKQIQLIKDAVKSHLKYKEKMLEIGCSVGRACFELAETFDNITGLDFTARNISFINDFKNHGYIRWEYQNEGNIIYYNEVNAESLGYNMDKVRKINFIQGDACNIKSNVGKQDLIIALNVIEYLYKPQLFLEQLPNFLNENGLLIISSNYDWRPQYTEETEWLGGIKNAGTGENQFTYEQLKENLSQHFIEVQKPINIEKRMKINERKYEILINEFTFWKLK